MQNLQDIINNKDLYDLVSSFLSQYGSSGLKDAINFYMDMQQEYICRTKISVSKFRIFDIYYIKIQGHHMSVYTTNGVYEKYGSLSQELKFLSPYGFIKCSQNCIVSLHKIERISQNEIFLIDGTIVYMSRCYAPKVLMNFNRPLFCKNKMPQ